MIWFFFAIYKREKTCNIVEVDLGDFYFRKIMFVDRYGKSVQNSRSES